MQAAHALLQSISDLMEPGSRVLFDFLHEDALDGTRR
jgi:O-methyltransferase involved in polyketide biosynthesis